MALSDLSCRWVSSSLLLVLLVLPGFSHPGDEGKKPERAEPSRVQENPDSQSSSDRDHKRLWRGICLTMGLMVPQSVRYWVEYTEWIEDWQFELTWSDQKQRFFTLKAQKFDSNPFFTNWTHAISGAGYYNFARYQGLNQWESVLYGMGFSLWWEYITEWREVISINDNIFSGLNGAAMGEPLFQLGRYFHQQQGLLNRILGTVFNPVYTLNYLLETREWKDRKMEEEGTRPQFHLYLGQKQAYRRESNSRTTQMLNVRLDSAIHSVPGSGEPGQVVSWCKDPLFSEIRADFSFDRKGVTEYSLYFKTVLWGYYQQNLRRSSGGELRGHWFFGGVGTAFDLYRKRGEVYYDQRVYHVDFEHGETLPLPTRFSDKMAVVNLAGPALDISWFRPALKFRLSFFSALDFAMVNSRALNRYSENDDLFEPSLKTTLSYYGYYYAVGVTVHPRFWLVLGGLELEGELKYQTYRSLQGLDRFQFDLKDDSPVRDSRLVFRFSLGVRFPHTPVTVQLALEGIHRQGVFKDVFDRQLDYRYATRLVFEF